MLMRVLMRTLRKSMVLGLAGLGAYKAWELASDRIGGIRDHAARVKGQLAPVVRDAEGDVVEASRLAVASVAEAVGELALDVPDASGRPSSQTG